MYTYNLFYKCLNVIMNLFLSLQKWLKDIVIENGLKSGTTRVSRRKSIFTVNHAGSTFLHSFPWPLNIANNGKIYFAFLFSFLFFKLPIELSLFTFLKDSLSFSNLVKLDSEMETKILLQNYLDSTYTFPLMFRLITCLYMYTCNSEAVIKFQLERFLSWLLPMRYQGSPKKLGDTSFMSWSWPLLTPKKGTLIYPLYFQKTHKITVSGVKYNKNKKKCPTSIC